MQHRLYTIAWLTVFLMNVTAISAQKRSVIDIMSFNIRMNYQDDGVNNWEPRRIYMVDLIQRYQPDLLGIQEAYYPQYTDLKTLLSDYNAFGPAKGRQGAESVGIFYLRDKLICLDSGTFWLSETPEKQSLGWDAGLRRTVTWGEFKLKSNNDKLYMFVTHFDHKGTKAMEESAKLLLRKVNEIAGNYQAFIVGDFNFKEESPYYKILTGGVEGIPGFYDTGKLAKKYIGPAWTLHDFGRTALEKRPKIDYIFTNKKLYIPRFLNIDEHQGDFYPSDHNPQMVTAKVDP